MPPPHTHTPQVSRNTESEGVSGAAGRDFSRQGVGEMCFTSKTGNGDQEPGEEGIMVKERVGDG